MSNLIKLSFALFLGLVAAGANWLWVSSKAKPPEFVAAGNALKEGETIDEDDLVAIPVPGDFESLKQSLIPFRHRALLFGAQAPRNYASGDVFFQRDIQPAQEDSVWDSIGPFRLISVGARFKEPNEATAAYAGDSSRNNVTIEVSATFEEQTRRLLEVLRPKTVKGKRQASEILAVQTLAKGQAGNEASVAAGDAVYQTISLDGIPSVPRVLLAGDMIQFIIPGRKKY